MPRPPLATVLLALACAVGAAEPVATSSATPVTQPRHIIFGSDLAPDRPAAARELFHEAGLNCVRLTGGGYAWAAGKHRELADALAAKGVQVYLQLGSHYPSADYFPLKDAWLVDQNGVTGVEDRKNWAIRYDHSCWPQYSYAHEGIRQRFAKDFTAYLGKFPPAPQLAGVILHNEPGMHWLKERVFDYSAVGVAAFRAWLPSQHGDIATLNRRWGSAFTGFDAVAPPLKADPANPGAWLDWRRFQVVQIAAFMRWEAGFAKGLRPDLATTTNLDGPTNNWYAIRCADVEAHSRAMDTVGMDIYPTPWTGREFVPYAMDQLQGVAQGRRAHVLECEVFGDRAPDWKKLPAEQRADLLRSELWTMYGHGADGILLWGFSRGDGFTITDGAWNPRVLACRDVAHQVAMLGLGRFRRAPSAVAICLDPDAYIRASALETSTLAGGSALDLEFHGIHAALAAVGIQCDVIMAAQLPAVTEKYRALVMPASPLMDEATAALLASFTAKGGTLIAEAPFATADRWGAALPVTPGFGLDRIVGAGATPALLPERSGTEYGAGKNTDLPLKLATLLAGIPCLDVRCTGTRPDASLLSDGANRLLVVAAQGSQASATAPAEAVTVTIPGPLPRAAYAFPSTAVTDGTVRSGPVIVPVAAAKGGCTVELGTISSALPVLLASDSGPLLALAAPATVKAGAATALTVTCHNPSGTTLTGTVELRLAGTTVSAPVTVAPWGSAKVDLAYTAPAATPRLALGAVLHGSAGDVTAIPVDVAVQ